MRKILISFFFVVIMVQRAISATVAPAIVDPDRVSKGSTGPVIITLDKNIPDQTEIKLVRIAGYDVTTEPPKDSKLTLTLPQLNMVGPAKIDVIGKDGTVVTSGQLTFVDGLGEASSILGVGSSVFVIFVYVLLIVSLPWAATIIDISKGYRDQRAKWRDLLTKLPSNINLDQLRPLLAELDQGPPGTSGLTRGAVALTLLLILGIALFHIVIFVPNSLNLVEKILTLLTGAFTSITGFYFGSRAVTQDTKSQPGSSPSPGPGPVITSVKPGSGAPGEDVILTGQGFGTSGTVFFDKVPATTKSWTDTSITVPVPVADPGSVKITVTPTGGNPLQADFTISPKSAGGVLKAPTIDSLKPPSAAPGEDVILTGQGFGTSGTVFFDKVPAASKSWTDTSITLTVPTVSPGPVKIAVTPTGSNPLQLDFTVTALQAQPTV